MRHVARTLVLALVFVLVVGTLLVAAQDDAAKTHEAAVRSALAEFSSGNPDPFFALFPETYLMNQGGSTLEPMSRTDMQAFANALRGAIPDLQITPAVLIAQGDELVVELTFSGTFSQPFSFAPISSDPIPPTNHAVLWTEMDFLHFNDAGLISEQWSLSDPMVLFAQLGFFPAENDAPTGTPLESPAGSQALSADALAASLSSGMEARNLELLNEQVALGLGTFTQYYTDPYIAWSNAQAFSVTASEAQQDGAFIDIVKQAMPDNVQTLTKVVSEGDWVAAVGTISGTFTQDVDLFGTALTHTDQPIVWTAGIVARYNSDGKIVEVWQEGDASPLLQGLGVIPAQGS